MRRMALLAVCVVGLSAPALAQFGAGGGFGGGGAGAGGLGGGAAGGIPGGGPTGIPGGMGSPGGQPPLGEPRLPVLPPRNEPARPSTPSADPRDPRPGERSSPPRGRGTERIAPEGAGERIEQVRAPEPPRQPAPRTSPAADGPRVVPARLDPATTVIPEAALRAHQRDRAAVAACDSAKVALRVELYRAQAGQDPDFARLQQRARDPAILALIEAHDLACLLAPDAATRDAEAARVAEALASMRPRIGAVITEDGEAHCTGLLLDAMHVATARHCLYRDEDGQGGAAPRRIGVAFARWVEPANALPVDVVLEAPDYAGAGFEQRHRLGDFAVLRLRQPVADPRVASLLPVAPPQTFQRISVFGLQSLLGQGQNGGPPRIRPSQSWSPLLRHEVRADCRIGWTTPRGCFFYACNAEGGWSGGPVLAIADATDGRPAEPVLLGIHTGGLSRASLAVSETDCGSAAELAQLPDGILNVGAPVPGWVARHAGR